MTEYFWFRTRSKTCHLFHDWSKWGPIQVGKRLYGNKPIGDLVYQQRECKRCGAVQQRTVLS